MTIKIIYRGTPPDQVVYKVTCGQCNSILEYKKSDATVSTSQHDLGNFLKCPVCFYNILVTYVKKTSSIDPY